MLPESVFGHVVKSSVPFAGDSRAGYHAVEPDERFMRAALEQAREARQRNEVPVGAVVVLNDEIVGAGFNQPIGTQIRPRMQKSLPCAPRPARWQLPVDRLDAIRDDRTVSDVRRRDGPRQDRTRSCTAPSSRMPVPIESAMRAHEHPALNHRMTATGGVLEPECRDMIQEFFRGRR